MAEFETTEERARAFLQNRQRAYLRVFGGESAEVKEVIADLKKFCLADESAYDPDPRTHALLSGRQEVWIRISEHLNLKLDQLYDRYTIGPR
jgi:hypothetical protein